MKRRIAILLAASLLSSCGGGGTSGNGTIPVTPTNAPKSPATKSVKIALVLPSSSATSAQRHTQFVSPSAQGASIAVTGALGGSGSAVVDLSSGSSACTTTGSQRTCTASVVVPLDNDTFTLTLFDAPPSGGAIPSTAHVLGVGSVTQPISLTFTGSVPIVVGGTVSNIGLNATYASVPADGLVHSVAIVVNPTDFGNNPISATPSPAPYSNPIHVALTETGGINHAHLVLNGSPAGISATLSSSSDSVSLAYDGAGIAGYSDSVTLTATGAPTQTLTVSPLYLSSTSPFFVPGTRVLSLNGTVTNIPIAATEAGAPSATVYTATPAGCTNIATVGAISGSGPSASFSVQGGNSSSATGCTVTVSDSLSTTMAISVINSPIGGTVPLPGESIQEYAIAPNSPPNTPASPQAMVLGPDGNIWLADVMNNKMWSVTPAGVATTRGAIPASIFPGEMAAGADGNIYANGSGSHVIAISTTTGAVSKTIPTSYFPLYFAAGADGNMWFTEQGAGGHGLIGTVTPGGVKTEYDISPGLVVASPLPNGIAANPDGTGLWFCSDINGGSSGVIGSITLSGTMTLIATLPSSDDCITIAFEPDGKAAWAASGNNDIIYRVDATTHVVTPIATTSVPTQITYGADNAMYVSESGTPGKVIDRISTVSPYAVSPITAPNGIPSGIALGADGRIWYGENTANSIGALTP